MKRITKFPIEQNFKDRLKSHGFSVDDPDRRYPIRNDFPLRVLDLRSRDAKGRVAQLLGDRGGRNASERTRLFPWLAPLGGLFGWPEWAQAHDHHPPMTTDVALAVEPRPLNLDGLMDLLAQIDFDQPIWALAMMGTLVLTQAVGLLQRRALLKMSTVRAESVQSDLFPETLPENPPGEDGSIWEVDAATRQGQVREENQDAFCVIRFSDGSVVIVICDGAGGVGGGREASTIAVAVIEETLQNTWDKTGQLVPKDLEAAIAAAQKSAKDKRLEGVTTALLVLFDSDQMHFATLGDGAITVIWPDGMVGPVQVPHHLLGRPSNEIGAYIGGDCKVPARTGTLRLEPGSIVLTMTDGASDLITFEDIARHRHQYKHVGGLADHMLAHLEAARDPETGAWLHSDNMTLALARLSEEGDHDPEN